MLKIILLIQKQPSYHKAHLKIENLIGHIIIWLTMKMAFTK